MKTTTSAIQPNKVSDLGSSSLFKGLDFKPVNPRPSSNTDRDNASKKSV